MTDVTKQRITYAAIGAGVGVAVTGTTAYIIAHKKLKRAKKQLEEARKAQHRAYIDGIEEATEEAQRWIDEHVLRIDADDPESAQKAIDKAFSEAAATPTETQSESSSPSPEISPSSEPQQKTPVCKSETSDGKSTIQNADDIYEEKSKEVIADDEIGFRFHGKLITYPRKLFFDDDGVEYGETRVRENLRQYETDIGRLKEIWLALGFGEYCPEEDADVDLEDWDLNIEGDEPEIKSKERERYLEQVKRYNNNPNEGPRIVSKKEFDEECYLSKANITYYAGDNVFVDSTDMDNPIDPVLLLGVSDGNYLYSNKPQFDPDEDDNDPDIVYVRNFKMNTIAEVTRDKRTYASVADGSVYLDGETDRNGGTEGV